jgi:HKD family nuclease
MNQPEQHLYTGGDDYFLKRLIEAVNHADVINIAVSFIRSTGLVLLIEPLAEALTRGAEIKIITGDYLQITEPQALRMLMLLKDEGAEIRIFESNNVRSFHMKAYIFTNIKMSVIPTQAYF